MGIKKRVRDYFQRCGPTYDRSYDEDLPLYRRVGDRLFRRIIHERRSLVLAAAGSPGQSVLDIGTGSGRYLVDLAQRGASRCVGIDLSPAMIDIGRDLAARAAVSDRIEWVVGDYLEWPSRERFDTIISTGCFEYLPEPLPYLQKVIDQCGGTAWLSFAKRWELRTPFRLARMVAEHGYVRFFGRGDLLTLFRAAGDPRYLHIMDLGRDYLAIYNAGAARAAQLSLAAQPASI